MRATRLNLTTVILSVLVTTCSAQQDSERKRPTVDEHILFQPRNTPRDNWKPRGLTFEDVRFRSADGTRLHGWYCPARNPRAVVLYLHGNAGNLSHRAARVRELQRKHRVTVFIPDYRGYGKSEGQPTVAGALADATAARNLAAQLANVKESEIVLLGRSLGGAIAVQLAAEKKPRGLIIESSFSSYRDIAKHHLPWAAWIVPRDRLNSITAIRKYKGPLLQCHGNADTVVPFEQGRALYDAAPGWKQFVTIDAGGHNDPPTAEYARTFDRFIASLK